jgi:signal transduction histidine kinase
VSLPDAPEGADPQALWLSQMAHDLRNQLAPMRTATQMMQLGKLDAARQREMLDLLERQIQRLVGMLDDLAEFGKQRAGLLPERERHDLGILIDTALGECGRRIVAAGQRFEQRMPEQRMPLLAERQPLVQLFIRLLDNASRFTPEGGLIELDVTLDGGQAEVRVRDSGAGIEADRLESIFELPFRGRSGGGLGISLVLARACAQRHGGTLVARSEGPGRGSEFVLRIPLVA